MIKQLPDVELPRPAPVADAGPLDDRLYDLVETRVRRLLVDNPIVATFLGIHTEDHRLGDPSRDAVLGEIAADRSHLAAIEALDPAGLSPSARFERDLELHNLRLGLFDSDEIRRWERRSTAAGELGDAVFLLFARGAAPLGERIERIADRLAEAPAFLEGSKTRAAGPQVAVWQRTEARYAADLPGLFAEVRAAAVGALDGATLGRLDRAIAGADARPRSVWRLGDRHAGGRHRRLAARRGALRRAGPAPGVRGPRRRRDPGDRTGAAAGEPRSAAGGGARDRPRRRPAERHRPGQVRRTGHVRRGAGGLPRRHAPRPCLPDRARHRLDPGRRDDRGPADARVPALGHAVRRVLLARPVRRRQARPVHRDAGGRQRPQRDARALLGGGLEHEHPRGLPGPPPPARGRLPPSVPHPDAHRRARVHRGLGHVLRAADARGGVRRRAGVPRRHVHGRRSGGRAGSSSTSGCTAAS